jgi:hypothetical protein
MSPFKGKVSEEVRQTWQCRALIEADSKLQRVMLIALTKEYPTDLLRLLQVAFGTIEIPDKFYSGYARIVQSGQVVCMYHEKDGNGLWWKGFVPVYDSEEKFRGDMRRLADRLKLDDADRIEMFAVLQKWVARDERVNEEGHKLAS